MTAVEGGREVKIEVDATNEQVVIGATIAGWDNGIALKMFRTFQPDHFLATEHNVAWTWMRELHKRQLGWDLATLRQLSGGRIDDGICDLLTTIADARWDVPQNLEFHVAAMLRDRSKQTAMGPITHLIELIQDPNVEPERLQSLARQIHAALKSGEPRRALHDPKALVRAQMAQIRARRDGRSYPFCLDGLDYFESHEAAGRAGILDPEKIAGADGRVRRMMPGTEPGYITLISSQSGGGKALALDTPIATPDGWTTMGDIRVGDKVFDENGEVCDVVLCSPVARDHDCYRVSFSDCSSIVADADHLWLTRDDLDRSMDRDGSVRTMTEIAKTIVAWHSVVSTRPSDKIRVLRYVVEAERVPSVPVRCIMVNSKSHLYLAGRAMIPTHNTTLASSLALNIARTKRRVLYCAWEPKPGLTLESLACQSLGWSRSRILQGQATEEELAVLNSTMSRISKWVHFMDKSAFFDFGGQKKSRTNEENLDIFANYVADSGCDVVIADLWKYALVSQRPDDEEEALKYQQAMCEDLKFHLFLLQQQGHKRYENQRPDKRPTREGVKGSGTYLEIVDNFLAPHIPSLWKPGIPPDRFELFVLKQRYGRWPLGVQFDWDPDSGELKNGATIMYDDREAERSDGDAKAMRGRSGGRVIGEPQVFTKPMKRRS